MTISKQIREELTSIGLRATVPRVAILEVFRDEQQRQAERAEALGEKPSVVHFSADEMFKRLVSRNVDVGIATVYRVMQQFEEAGVLSSSRFDTERVTYELNEGRPHDHMVCMNCGRVDEFNDAVIVARHKIVAQGLGYILHNHQLALYGICPTCQAKMSTQDKKEKTPTSSPDND